MFKAPVEDSTKRKRPTRKYTSRACEGCRHRRAKCDGVRPSCARCFDRGIRCEYSTAEDGRQPAPKSYVVMLRNRIDILERVLRSHGIDADAAIAQLMLENEDLNPTQDPCASGASYVDDLCVTFDGALTLDESLNFDQDGEVRYFGPTSGRLLFRSSDSEYLPSTGYTSDNYASAPATAVCDTDVLVGSSMSVSDELQAHLIDLYFEWEQPWVQVVCERLFRDSLVCGGRYSSPFLLNCILALGSRYCDLLEVRSEPNDANTAGKAFMAKAENLLQHDLRWPTITTIQGLAIMGTFYIATGSDAAGWLHQGMANRLAIDMGFNMDPAVLTGKVALPTDEIELRRKVYWALYCHDKLSASYTGRVCTLLDSQGAVKLPDIESGLDIHLPAANGQPRAASERDVVLLHRAMIELCRILEKILLSLWSPKPLLHANQRSAFFDSCILQLRTWHYDLPSELKINQQSVPSKFPHIYTLYMIYHTAHLLLCRPFMINHPSEEKSDVEHHEEQDHTTNDDPRTQRALSTSCNSIRAMCYLSQQYRQTFGSFRLSPITATHCILSTAFVIIERLCSAQVESCVNPPIDGSYTSPASNPHDAVALFFQIFRELSTSWNIAKRIGRNLEKVYEHRFGSRLFPRPPEDVSCPMPGPIPPDGNTVPPLEDFDGLFTVENMLATPFPISLGDPLLLQPNENFFTAETFPLGGHSNMIDPQTSDELFANNLGCAFTPECLPSDYNMFDTLNQMYLEETSGCGRAN
ncbi:hypothetical protein N7495_004835 [Penicillium taxi]|uniref:uncharacterized protein n=1 Tax=Penicillium taxi TaxID=168475 RepID=UPI0025450FBA|nr:uncharacterized protein N7495_004835 [Penicillium taxi]KAJ5900091.1 hypothetical protein N7495_004835 [Penicillium taxi]